MEEVKCAKCGEVLVPGKSFCANCGNPVEPGATYSPAAVDLPTPVTSTPGGGHRWAWWAVGAVLLLAVVGGGVGAMVMAQNRAAEQAAQKSAAERADRLAAMKKAYEAVVVVQSATAVGVNYQDYGSRVRDAAAALAVYDPSDKDGEAVKSGLESAMDYYTSANNAWATKFEDYETVAFEAFKSSRPELSESYSADDAIQIEWQKADTEMAAAKAAITRYEGAAKK